MPNSPRSNQVADDGEKVVGAPARPPAARKALVGLPALAKPGQHVCSGNGPQVPGTRFAGTRFPTTTPAGTQQPAG